MIIKYAKYGGIDLSKLRIPRIVALLVVVAISAMMAGLSIGADAPAQPVAPPVVAGVPEVAQPQVGQPILTDIEPLGDNEHFGVANAGTAPADLGSYDVAIDNGNWVTLPQYILVPGEEINFLFDPRASANELGEKDLFLGAAGLTLNDNAGRIALKDSAGIVRSEVTYSHTPPEPAGPEAPAAPAK